MCKSLFPMIALKLCERARVVTGEATYSLNALKSLYDDSSSNDVVLSLRLCGETLLEEGAVDGADGGGSTAAAWYVGGGCSLAL
jgi:hypothetical protein